MAVPLLTRGELGGALRVVPDAVERMDLDDPVAWADLQASADLTVDVAHRRVRSGKTPARAQVFRWPKEQSGWRPLAWLDPFDHLIYWAATGRLVGAIEAGVDRTSVFSARVVGLPPGWKVESWGSAIEARQAGGLTRLEDAGGMGVFDLKNCFTHITTDVLGESFDPMPIEPSSRAWLLSWLGDLHERSGVPGLPMGHQPSHVLANALLCRLDRNFITEGINFGRYVDDIWVFGPEAHFWAVEGLVRVWLVPLRQELNDAKTAWFGSDEAVEVIAKSAIGYVDQLKAEPDADDRSAALDLFDHALEDPVERRAQLRYALSCLRGHRDPAPLEALRHDENLMRIAPAYWVRYLRSMMANKKSRREVGDDWLIEQATRPFGKDDAYLNFCYLRAVGDTMLGKGLGRQVFTLFESDEAWNGWKAPIRVWASHVWGQSGAFRPDVAVEAAEGFGDIATRRGFALTLKPRSTDKKASVWNRKLRLTDEELEPTVAWLEAA